MLGNGQRKGVSNVCLALLCIVLFALFAGLIVWSSKEEAKDSRRLQKLAQEEESRSVQTKEKKKDAETTETQEDTEEEAIVPMEKTARGIVCWGDDLINGEASSTYSYRAVLQNLLNENGYDLPVLDKTIQGGGTLSMMTMAGVPEEEVQAFITAHKTAANGGQLHITETGIRDLTPEQLDRSDSDCIPIIFMGFYGGWNHDPNELAQQQEKILNTFQDKEKFIIVGISPMDGSVDSASLDSVMQEKWGEHYISAASVMAHPAASYEGQSEIAQAVLQKLEELSYIAK